MSAAPKTKAGGRHPIDPGKIPAEMRSLDRWVVWRLTTRKGKPTKMPLQARVGKGHGGRSRRLPADSTDPTTWATFDEAMAAYLAPNSDLDGIGFVFATEGPFAGVDFDNCLDDQGDVLEWARPYLDRLIGYAEVSPSGKGIKAFVRGEVPGGSGRKLLKLGPDKKGAIEVYDRGRFFTVTSRVLDDHASIGDGGAELARLHAEWFPPEAKARKRKPPEGKPLRGDAELIAKAQSARNGSKFSTLWAGSPEGYPSKSEADLALCSLLAFWTGGDVEAIDRLFRQSGLCDEKWERITYREPTIDKACDRSDFYDPNYRKGGERYKVFVGDSAGDDQGPPSDPPRVRPPIEVNTQQHEVVEASIKAMQADADLYRRGDELVMVVSEDKDLVHLTTMTTMKNAKGSPKIIALAEQVLGERLTRVGDFFKWKNDTHGELVSVPTLPPTWLIANIHKRKYWPGIRPLIAVAECPFPRPDGSIVDEPGYDAATAILYAPSMDFPPLQKSPTRKQAVDAWSRIRRKFRHYPFASEEDEVVVLAGMLNVVARHGIIGPMPGIAVNGNKAGIGKGFLIDAMVIPGTGRLAPISKYPYDSAEAGKVKTSIVASGKTVVSFDNLGDGTRYGGEDIDSLMTAKVTDDRLLGLSKNTGELIVRLVCFVNGNNIEPVRDAYRRWLVCNLVTEHEHPERRDIRNESGEREKTPDVQMLEDRSAVVADLLTILKAHSSAGWPNGGWSPLGSFEHWDKVVRGAVWYATGIDCTKTQERAAEESQDNRDKVALLEGLRELPGAKFGERGVTSVEAVAFVEGNPDRYHTLRSALIQRGTKGKPADSRTLGNVLKGLVNTPIGSMKLRKHPVLKHSAVAWVVDIANAISKGESVESGESVNNTPRSRAKIDYDVTTYGGNEELRKTAAETDSPDSTDSPSNIRQAVAQWLDRYRLRFEEVVMQLLADGFSEPANEIEAFAKVRAEMDADPMVVKATGGSPFAGRAL